LGACQTIDKVLRKIKGISNMETFEQAWAKVADPENSEPVSADLRPLLRQVYETIIKQPPDFLEIKGALVNLLSFLNSEVGRTSANCMATDLFFCLADWGIDWDAYPEPLTEILDDMGGTLHDTVSNPEIARNFYSLPEQLLERLHQWTPA
jgi:hypothetical protein